MALLFDSEFSKCSYSGALAPACGALVISPLVFSWRMEKMAKIFSSEQSLFIRDVSAQSLYQNYEIFKRLHI